MITFATAAPPLLLGAHPLGPRLPRPPPRIPRPSPLKQWQSLDPLSCAISARSAHFVFRLGHLGISFQTYLLLCSPPLLDLLGLLDSDLLTHGSGIARHPTAHLHDVTGLLLAPLQPVSSFFCHPKSAHPVCANSSASGTLYPGFRGISAVPNGGIVLSCPVHVFCSPTPFSLFQLALNFFRGSRTPPDISTSNSQPSALSASFYSFCF